MEDGGRPMSPASQPQAPIKQEVDHHLPDFHDNISLPVSNFHRLCISYFSFRLIISSYFCSALIILHMYIFTLLFPVNKHLFNNAKY